MDITTIERKKFRRNFSLVLILLISSLNMMSLIATNTSVSFSPQIRHQVRAVKNWTVMLYFCADSRDHYVTGTWDNSENFIHEALASTLNKELTLDDWVKLVLKCGEINLKTMEILDAANTGAYGQPVPTKVPLGAKKGKAILVSGHDLKDMEDYDACSQDYRN